MSITKHDSIMSTDTVSVLKDGISIERNDLEYAEELDIKFGLLIGRGGYSYVYKGKYKSNPVALKVCKNTGAEARLMKQETVVFDVLKERPHKNIIKFLENFESRDYSHKWILMEWFEGIDLAAKLNKKEGPFEESVAKNYFKQLVEGLRFLNSLHIVHRDLKLDNILVGFDANDCQKKECIKIIDFGFAKKVELKEDDDLALCRSRLGTEVYMAPEILNYKDNQDYDAFKSDVFSIAVILYVFLFGTFPDREKTFEFPEQMTYKVSESVKTLILNMSREDSWNRFNINQILDSEWMQSLD